MTNYSIYIDETGSFYPSKNKDTNFVGGFVSSNFPQKSILEKINPKLDEINKIILEEYSDDKMFNIINDLHYAPLHYMDSRGEQDSHIKVPVEKVPEIIQLIVDNIYKNTDFIFRSRGFSSYFINEQSSYFELLRATIFQLLDDPIFDKDNVEKITINIASRKSRKIFGEKIYENFDEYEKKIINKLIQEIQTVFKLKNFAKKVEFCITSARDSFELQIADIFIGCLRNDKYIGKYKDNNKTREYYLDNAFKYQPKRKVEELKNIFSLDKSNGLILTFEYLSNKDLSEGNKTELYKLLEDFFSKTDKDDEISFFDDLKLYLESKTTKDTLKYQNLDFIENYIKNIQKNLQFIKSDLYRNKIDFVLKKNYLKVHSHTGRTNLEPVDDFLNIIENNDLGLFSNIYELLQERLESKLRAIPIVLNSLKFDDWENKLTEELKLYKSILKLVGKEIIISQKDNNLAKIAGTLGQIYAFMYDINKDEDYYDFSESYIKEDITYCLKNTEDYFKALGYLTTLYFKKGNLEKAEESFLNETSSTHINKELIYNLSKTELFKLNDKSPFYKLHRIYLCALAQKINNKEIIGVDKFVEDFIKSNTPLKYPNFLTAKWLGVILANQGKLEKAKEIFDLITSDSKEKEFIIKVINLPINLLSYHTNKLLGVDSLLDIETNLHTIDLEVSGTTETLTKIGFYEYLHKPVKVEELYNIALMMPFYYA